SASRKSNLRLTRRVGVGRGWRFGMSPAMAHLRIPYGTPISQGSSSGTDQIFPPAASRPGAERLSLDLSLQLIEEVQHEGCVNVGLFVLLGIGAGIYDEPLSVRMYVEADICPGRRLNGSRRPLARGARHEGIARYGIPDDHHMSITPRIKEFLAAAR